MPTSFDYEYVMENSRVCWIQNRDGKSERSLAYRFKIQDELKNLFEERFKMHKHAYQHRVTKFIEEMYKKTAHMTEFSTIINCFISCVRALVHID